MKFASFFIALLVGAPAAAAAAGDGEPAAEAVDFFEIYAAPPQHTSCERFGSAYTGKSGKGMSMGKSGKGLTRTSKSAKANSELGTGKLFKVTVDFYGAPALNNVIYVYNVQGEHCVGELAALLRGALNIGG